MLKQDACTSNLCIICLFKIGLSSNYVKIFLDRLIDQKISKNEIISKP